MKKIFTIALSFTMLLTFLTACGSKKQQDININDVATQIKDNVEFKDELTQADKDVISSLYSVDLSEISDYVVYVSGTSATAEEIAIFKAKDNKNVKSIEDSIKERIEDQKISFEDYRPDEMKSIENAIVKTSGNYVFYVITADYDKANEIVDKYI